MWAKTSNLWEFVSVWDALNSCHCACVCVMHVCVHMWVSVHFNNKVLTLPSKAHPWGFPVVCVRTCVHVCVCVCLCTYMCVCVCHFGKHISVHHSATPARGCGCLWQRLCELERTRWSIASSMHTRIHTHKHTRKQGTQKCCDFYCNNSYCTNTKFTQANTSKWPDITPTL